jgi:hypothetical protein
MEECKQRDQEEPDNESYPVNNCPNNSHMWVVVYILMIKK